MANQTGSPYRRAYDSVPVPVELARGWRASEAAAEHVAVAERMEYQVFLDAGFCSPRDEQRVTELDRWREQSRFQVVLAPDGTVRGAVRVIVGRYDELPVGSFPRDLPLPPDPVLEYASLAVPASERGTGVAEALYRTVWTQALRRGVQGMVAIGEDWLLDILNGVYDLGFVKLGPSRWYMGGECFPMGVTIPDLIERLNHQPSFFRWATAEIDLRDLDEGMVADAVQAARSAAPD